MQHSPRAGAVSTRLYLAGFVAIVATLEARAEPVYFIEQGYIATFSNYPVLPTDPADPVTLVTDGANRDFLPAPFDDSFSGVGRNGLGSYSVRVAANSDFGHLRAALQTSFDFYSESNYTTAIFQEGAWQFSVGGEPYVANLDTYVHDAILVTGSTGLYDATFNFEMHGTIASSFGFDRSNGTPIPVASGRMGLTGFGPNPDGSAIPLLEAREFDGEVLSFTVHGLKFGEYQTLVYWMQLSQFTPSTYDLTLTMSGSVNYDLFSTATLESVIISAAPGTDLSKLRAQFASGARASFVFQGAATGTPEPGGLTLAALGAVGLLGACWVRKRRST